MQRPCSKSRHTFEALLQFSRNARESWHSLHVSGFPCFVRASLFNSLSMIVFIKMEWRKITPIPFKNINAINYCPLYIHDSCLAMHSYSVSDFTPARNIESKTTTPEKKMAFGAKSFAIVSLFLLLLDTSRKWLWLRLVTIAALDAEWIGNKKKKILADLSRKSNVSQIWYDELRTHCNAVEESFTMENLD